MKTKTLRNWDGETWLISKKLNNGDWDYWLLIKGVDLREYLSDNEITDNYCVDIQAVSLEAAGIENLKKAIECCGNEDENIDNLTDIQKVEYLADYGIFAQLRHLQGNNLGKLLSQAKKELQQISGFFGSYMDKAENLIGNNGWDFISGSI